jgi:acetylornithine deacetylase/succinyl-diaminopimelate desuccinylase-like protein
VTGPGHPGRPPRGSSPLVPPGTGGLGAGGLGAGGLGAGGLSTGGLSTAEEEAIAFTADLVRIDTTNRGGGEARERPAAEYVAGRLADAGLDPLLLESAPGRASVVARVTGTRPQAPGLLVHGHLDVVPASPAGWEVPPFAGEIRGGVLWGRGTVDMKSAIAVMLALARQWARGGQPPGRDIVLAFTADEEDTGAFGARWLVEHHRELFEGCCEAIGESGGFTFHAGHGLRLYPIASAERGTAWLKLTAHGRDGHGSKPSPDNAVSALAAAVARIGAHRWPVRLIPVVREAVTAIAAAVGADPELDAGELLAQLGPAAELVSATVRNSANPTMLRAGEKVNVIPAEATAYVDGRVLPGFEEEFAATIDALAGPRVTWEYAHREPPVSAPAEAPLVTAMAAALRAEDPGAIPVPYCMSGGTDAKQFARLGMRCYGFTPLRLPPGYDYFAMFHGTGERVPVDALRFAVRVMDRLLTGRSRGEAGS